MLRATRSVPALAVVAISALGGTARAEVLPGRPDESIQQAYGTIVAGTVYSGAFDNTSYDDVDYLAFVVSHAGESFHFTVTNTTQSCNDPDLTDCPVFATLMDSTGNQVGGDTSTAGTSAVTTGAMQTIDWTFTQPGTYYLLMESNGDEAPGSPSYSVSFMSISPAPVLSSLTVRAHQRGTSVAARFDLGQSASTVTATLVALHSGGQQKPVTTVRLFNLAAGPHQLTIRLPASWSRKLKRLHHLSLQLNLNVVSQAGAQATNSRRVSLTF